MLSVDDIQLVQSKLFEKKNLSPNEVSLILALPQTLGEDILNLNTAPASWSTVSLCLLHLSCVQNVCKYLETADKVPSQLKESFLQSNVLLTHLLEISIVKTTVLRHTAVVTIIRLLDAAHAFQEICHEKLLFIHEFAVTSCEDKFFYALDVLTKILKLNSRVDDIFLEPETLLEKSIGIIKKNFNKENFALLIDFLLYATNNITQFGEIVIETCSVVVLDFNKANEYPATRTKFVKLLKSLVTLPNFSPAECTYPVKSFAAKLLSKLLFEVPKLVTNHKPDAHGFGGPKTPAAIQCCSSADVMLVINILLKCVVANIDNTDAISLNQTEKCVQFLICEEQNVSESLFAKKFVQLYMEQDDLLIEVMLLHLTICVLQNR